MIAKQVSPVKNFDITKYLGKWYEIARLEYRFERHLEHVTAEYSLNTNGTVKVDNRGFDEVKRKWKRSVGKAKFVNDNSVAALKVSFFLFFYAGYNVIALDSNYQYALVAGSNLNYLWLLSREKDIPENIKQDYLSLAAQTGYAVDKLHWTRQD